MNSKEERMFELEEENKQLKQEIKEKDEIIKQLQQKNKEKDEIIEKKKAKVKDLAKKKFKIDPEAIKLSDTCPEYAKSFPIPTLWILLTLTEGFKRRFNYGVAGYFGAEVEFTIPKGSFDPFLKNSPFSCTKTLSTFGTGRDITKYEKYSFSFDRESTNELFSLFKHCKAPTEKGWFQSTAQPKFIEHLNEEETEKIVLNESLRAFYKAARKFERSPKLENVENKNHVLHSMQVKFGITDRQKRPFKVRLQLFKNVGEVSGNEIIRLSFFYDTFTDGQLRGLQAIQSRKQKREEILAKKRKKREDIEETDPNKKQKSEEEEEKEEEITPEEQQFFDEMEADIKILKELASL